MSATCSITLTKEAQQEVVLLAGIIDMQAEAGFDELASRITSHSVIFDFGSVGRINSMGIALLLRCFKRLSSEQKTIVLVRGLNQINSMLFKMSGVFLLAKEMR